MRRLSTPIYLQIYTYTYVYINIVPAAAISAVLKELDETMDHARKTANLLHISLDDEQQVINIHICIVMNVHTCICI